MVKGKVLMALAGALVSSALLASSAFAQSIGSPVTVGEGETLTMDVSSQPGAGELFRMQYPGGQQPVVISAKITGVGFLDTDNVGFDVYDTENSVTPVEHVTLARNQMLNDPTTMQFAYSSGVAGPVTFQFFNWTGDQVSVTVKPVDLPTAFLYGTGPTVGNGATITGVNHLPGVTLFG